MKTKIRVAKFYKMMEMLSGEYARSESEITFEEVYRVHPEDFKLLIEPSEYTVEAAQAATKAIGSRDWWHGIDDVIEGAEEGDPLAHAWLNNYSSYLKQNFEKPELEIVEGDVGWQMLPPLACVRITG